jgi:hypothetical protein
MVLTSAYPSATAQSLHPPLAHPRRRRHHRPLPPRPHQEYTYMRPIFLFTLLMYVIYISRHIYLLWTSSAIFEPVTLTNRRLSSTTFLVDSECTFLSVP